MLRTVRGQLSKGFSAA